MQNKVLFTILGHWIETLSANFISIFVKGLHDDSTLTVV